MEDNPGEKPQPDQEPLDLSKVAENPSLATYQFDLPDENLSFRPLDRSEAPALATFLEGLSDETRRLSAFEGYDMEAAASLVDAINKYDKLRMAVGSEQSGIVGLVELSFGLPQADIERFAAAGVTLSEETDVRFGPTFADGYQGRGLGSKVFPLVEDIAKKFGKSRIILWGGVLADNTRAIEYYKKFGFEEVGRFVGDDGLAKVDMMLTLAAS